MAKKENEFFDVLKDHPQWAYTGAEEAQRASGIIKETSENGGSGGDKNSGDTARKDGKAGPAQNVFYNKSDMQSGRKNNFDRNRSESDMLTDENINMWQNENMQRTKDIQLRQDLQDIKDNKYDLHKNRNTFNIGLTLVIFCIIVALLSIYCVVSDVKTRIDNGKELSGVTDAENFTLETSKNPSIGADETNVGDDGKYTIEGVANTVLPSIVEISSYETRSSKEPLSTGSGIILTKDGYIATNYHVLDGGKYFSVKTNDNEEYIAELTGFDIKTDIAVLKIDAADLTPASIGNSDDVKVGESVVAIGNPAGFSGTVTNGIVSALDREIISDESGYKIDCIQTNAALSPGNSGGALVNMYGQVIGITSSKYVSTNYEGIGFAITINQAGPIISELINNGYVDGRVRIGISFKPSDSDDAQNYYSEKYNKSMPKNITGIWVTDISKDSDISKTDLKVNDIITKINDEPVANASDVTDVTDNLDVGDSVTADCIHFDANGDPVEYTIKFEVISDNGETY